MSDNYVIGIDLGGTNLRVAAYADGLEFLEVIQLPTRLSEGRDQVVRDIRDAISSLQNRNFSGRTLAGVGVGAPGPLELPEGIVRNPPNLTGWDGFNLRAAIESALGRAIELDNDANVAALAEQRLGVGRKYEADSTSDTAHLSIEAFHCARRRAPQRRDEPNSQRLEGGDFIRQFCRRSSRRRDPSRNRMRQHHPCRARVRRIYDLCISACRH